MRKLLAVLLFCMALPAFGQTAQADLSWTDVTGETSYRVERSNDGGTTYATVGTTAANVATFTDTNGGAGFALNTLFCWRVVSLNTFGPAAPSAPACGQAVLPGQVLNLQLTLTPSP